MQTLQPATPTSINDKLPTWDDFLTAGRTMRRKPRMEELSKQVEQYRDQIAARARRAFDEDLSMRMDRGFASQQESYDHLVRRLESLSCQNLELRLLLNQLMVEKNRALTPDNAGFMLSIVGTLGVPNVIRDGILEYLHFQFMHQRQDTVAKSHAKTFQWVFKSPRESGAPWSDFSGWLESGSGCYWIQGKAGSGKSTLIKYLSRQEETQYHLREWSNGEPLITASFYFWYAGTPLQRSQEGLLRGLLHSILQQAPELIPRAVPDLTRAMAKSSALAQSEPTTQQLFAWFRNLAQALQEGEVPHRICLLVDGLDEYHGDETELAQLFLGMSKISTKIKFVLSSRCHETFLSAFVGQPTLRLQDLTREDIRHYTIDRLSPIPAVSGRDVLVKGVIEKAGGVFLWVSLATASLVRTYREGGTPEALEKEFESLPSELEKLFQRLLDMIPPAQHQEASKLLQIALWPFRHGTRACFTHVESPLIGAVAKGGFRPLQLYLAMEEPGELLQQTRQGVMSAGVTKTEEFGMASNFQARTMGFLESREEYGTGRPSLAFVHRSAVQFLSQRHVVKYLESLTATSTFDVHQAWFVGALGVLKAGLRPKGITQLDEGTLRARRWLLLTNAMDIACFMELIKRPAPRELLDELDTSTASLLRPSTELERSSNIRFGGSFTKVHPQRQHSTINSLLRPSHPLHPLNSPILRGTHDPYITNTDSEILIDSAAWTFLLENTSPGASRDFLLRAVSWGLATYVVETLHQMHPERRALVSTQLLVLLLQMIHQYHQAPFAMKLARNKQVWDAALAVGGDVNYMVQGQIPLWASCLVMCSPFGMRSDVDFEESMYVSACTMLVQMVEHGADLQQRFYYDGYEYSVTEFFQRVDRKFKDNQDSRWRDLRAFVEESVGLAPQVGDDKRSSTGSRHLALNKSSYSRAWSKLDIATRRSRRMLQETALGRG